jgi:hypothetical protein
MVGALCEGRAIQRQSIQCAGQSGLSRSSNQTDQIDETKQIPATRREMISAVGSLPEIQNVPVYSSGEMRRRRSRNDS